MDPNDWTADSDKHIKNIEAILNYRNVQGAVKCWLFAATLRKESISWYKSMRREYITSLEELCRQFIVHFAT